MAKPRVEVVIDGKNNTGPAIKEAGSDLQGLSKVAASVAATIGGVLSVGAFAGWIKGSIDAAAQLQSLSQTANTSTTQLQQWAVGARTVGLDQQQLADILKDVNDKVGDFLQTGGGELADFFEGIAPQIGVTAEQFKGLSGADALQLFVSSLEKANLSQAEMIFYLEGIASDASLLLPLLQNGGAGMRAWADEAERMGLVLGEDAIVQAKAFNEQLSVLDLATSNVGSQLSAAMLPSLQELSGLLLEVATDSEAASLAADVFGIALKVLATSAIGVGSTIASVGRSIGGLAAAAVAAATGELSQASAILDQLSADNAAAAAEAEERIRKLWSGEYQKAGARAATVNKQVTDSQDKVIQSAKNYQDQLKAGKKASDAADRSAKQLADQQESYVAGLEMQVATLGMTTVQVRAYELAEKGLAGALELRAQAALAAIEADEKKKQADANAATNAGLEADYLRAIGRDSDAAMLEIGTRFARMQKEFQATGNEAGLAWIDKLIPVEQAKVRLDEVQRQVDKILAEQQRQEQSVDVQQNSGLLTELDARQRILDIHSQTYEQLQQIRPVLEEMAQQPGAVGEAATAALQAMDAQAQQLLATTSLLESTLRDGLTSGLTEALTGLADGTLTLRDAVTTVADSVIDAMTRMAAESLAQSATKGLMGMFTGVTEAAPQAIAAVQQTASAQQAAITTVQTTQLAADTAMATSAATAATTTATAQAGAAAATEAAWTPAAITASIGSFGAAAAIGLAAVMAALAFKAFSTGGHVTGPGTGTSDDIPAWLSNDEFVTRSAVVRQPGALPFLEDFNARGMSALDDWATAVRHNTGGLAGVPAPAMPAPSLGNVQLAEPAKALGGATVQNAVNIYPVQDEAQVASMAWSKSGQEHFLVYLQRNSQTVKSILKV